MITLFKLGFEGLLFLATLFGGFWLGVKAQQKWPDKVAAFFAFFSAKA